MLGSSRLNPLNYVLYKYSIFNCASIDPKRYVKLSFMTLQSISTNMHASHYCNIANLYHCMYFVL